MMGGPGGSPVLGGVRFAPTGTGGTVVAAGASEAGAPSSAFVLSVWADTPLSQSDKPSDNPTIRAIPRRIVVPSLSRPATRPDQRSSLLTRDWYP
jgi:hypothetical protein